ncbi:MAG: hypothetical protein IKW90_17350 [Lachnospiraceae bacterium]|nr:hypothetical protein [Lachnospiraceae bacterium]
MSDSLFSKTRNKKIAITDIAIKKIPYIEYKGLTELQNKALYDYARQLLVVSKESNNSNEVSITVELNDKGISDKYGLCLGSEHMVDILSDPRSYHIIHSCSSCAVVILHNHPSTQTLSLWDISFFIKYATIKIMAVVTNQGNIHYIMKKENYSFDSAKQLLLDIINEESGIDDKRQSYIASLRFLSLCSEVGLYYH